MQFLSAKMLDIIGSIGGFIWNLLGMFWGLSGNRFGDLIRFLEIRWDFIVIECDSIGFHLIYCKHLHPNFCG